LDIALGLVARFTVATDFVAKGTLNGQGHGIRTGPDQGAAIPSGAASDAP